MTDTEFKTTANDLIKFIRTEKFNWGYVQNNFQDKKLNIFNIPSSDILLEQIDDLAKDDQDYIKKRWFSFKVAQCDEHIFCMNDQVVPNPNTYDKEYDFIIDGKFKFDLKSTVLPHQFDFTFMRVQDLIRFFYYKQSDGTRYHNQNRLFLVHFSMKDQSRNDYIKTKFKFKIDVIKKYLSESRIYFQQGDSLVDIILIYEDMEGDMRAKFYS